MEKEGEVSRQNGTTYGHFVEARIIPPITFIGGSPPPKVGNVWLGESWRRIAWPSSTVGVPNQMYNRLATEQGILTFEAASALMAWAAADNLHSGVEFRLVRVRMEYKWEIFEEGVGEAIDFSEVGRSQEYTKREELEEPTP